MTVQFSKVSHKIISRNGWSLWMPSNVIKGLDNFGEPDIYTESSYQLYPLGAKLEFADGRIFRYGKWGATSTSVPIGRFVVNANAAPSCTGYVGEDGFEGNCYAAVPIGQEYVDLWTILGALNTGYRLANDPFSENFFEDGMLVVFCDTNHGALISHTACYRICGNDATVTPKTRVYLDAPIKTAIVKGTAGAYRNSSSELVGSSGGTGVTAYPSLFSQLRDAADEGLTYTSAMGLVMTSTFTGGCFGWVQRAGLCDVAPYAYIGDAANERDIQLNTTDGTATVKGTSGTHRVGYLPTRTVSTYGDLQIWLQLE